MGLFKRWFSRMTSGSGAVSETEAPAVELPSILAKLEDHRRLAARPVTTLGDGEPTESKFSGQPLITKDRPWPACPNCGKRMQLFVQLDLASLHNARLQGSCPHPANEGFFQLFYCTTSEPLCEVDCEAYDAFSTSVVARIVEPGEPLPPEPLDDAFPARRIQRWKLVVDHPGWDELGEGVLTDGELDVLSETYPFPGDKLGGWPQWIQGAEYPDCPTCGQSMMYFFQIDSEDNLPYMFGDVGCGHVTFCPRHPDVLSFHWACH